MNKLKLQISISVFVTFALGIATGVYAAAIFIESLIPEVAQ